MTRISNTFQPKYNLDWAIENAQSKSILFFWGHKPEKVGGIGTGCLSQWWPCTFEKDGITYHSAEQWMMAGKAALFNDEAIFQEILATKDPKMAKALGRQVGNFNEETWQAKRYEIVIEGNLLKFSQNEPLKTFLQHTGDLILVEASPFDKIWGIGMGRNAPRVEYPINWKGQNLLGFALMEARDLLQVND